MSEVSGLWRYRSSYVTMSQCLVREGVGGATLSDVMIVREVLHSDGFVRSYQIRQ